MRIEIADCSGFCFGVKRAIRIAEEALNNNKGRPVYSLGYIIHNNQVVEGLMQKGLKPAKDVSSIEDGTVVISSHGTSPAVIERISAKGLSVVNAACPYVMSAQNIVKSLSADGYSIVIFGDRQHPEVESLVGFAGGKAMVVKDEVEFANAEVTSKRIGLVSQTTQLLKNYLCVISKVFERDFSEVRIFNTICNDTQKRQDSAARLAKEVDVMIIVGGRISANTKRLFEICSKICNNTYHIETAQELKKEWLEGNSRVGIAGGASTPDWIIEGIKNACLPADRKSYR